MPDPCDIEELDNDITYTVCYFDPYTRHRILSETWKLHGEFHRENEPAVIIYYGDSKIKIQKWYDHGKILGEEEYYKSGQLYTKHDYVNGIKTEYSADGSIKYTTKIIHDDQGNAHHILYDSHGQIKSESWADNMDRFHREDGPALIRYKNGHIQEEVWFIHGIELSEDEIQIDEFETDVSKCHNRTDFLVDEPLTGDVFMIKHTTPTGKVIYYCYTPEEVKEWFIKKNGRNPYTGENVSKLQLIAMKRWLKQL